MKQIFIFILLAGSLLAGTIIAQNTAKTKQIYKAGAVEFSISVAEIDSVIFTQVETNNAVMHIMRNNVAVFQSAAADIDSIVYYLPATPFTQENPISVTIYSGETHTFDLAEATAASDCPGTITYRWQQSSNNQTWINAIGVNTNASFTTPALINSVFYRRQATDACGTTITSASALVAVNAPISQNNPANAIVFTGTTHTFTLPAATGGCQSGIGIITYQWQQSYDNENWVNALGNSTSINYTTQPLTTNTYFRRQATDVCGIAVYSASALVLYCQ